jgi:hypothetical protein
LHPVLALQDIANRADRLGIEYDINTSSSLPPSEEQQIRNYMNKNDACFYAGDEDKDCG